MHSACNIVGLLVLVHIGLLTYIIYPNDDDDDLNDDDDDFAHHEQ